MKRTYQSPSIDIIYISSSRMLMLQVSSNSGVGGGDQGSGRAARSAQFWSFDWEEEVADEGQSPL
jgi:hypothetical protein